MIAFTANLANCSKLVPPIKSRGTLSQGAWMTGFYSGETYIENNVLHYYENRIKKAIKGKEDYLGVISDDLMAGHIQSTYQKVIPILLMFLLLIQNLYWHCRQY